MSTIHAEEALARVVQARRRQELADITYKRELRTALRVVTQQQVAAAIGISQAAVSKARKSAVIMNPDGFVGASPWEVCQRYAAGEIDRDELLRELLAWPYAEGDSHPSPADDVVVFPAGSREEIVAAFRSGLIDAEIYDAVMSAM